MGSGASVDGALQPSHHTIQSSGGLGQGDLTSSQHNSLSEVISSTDQQRSSNMSCEICSVNFTFFKRKKRCQECRRFFCSSCLPKPILPNAHRQCNKCELLISGHFSREDLQGWKVKDMRCFLNNRNISTKECREKHDLIELLLAQFCTRSRASIQNQAEHQDLVRQMAAHVRDVASQNRAENCTTSHQSNTASERGSTANGTNPESTEEASGAATERLRDLIATMGRLQDLLTEPDEDRDRGEQSTEGSPRAGNRRTHLEDISEPSDVESLTVRQLKELLVNNFVDYRGCCEKAELVDRVRRLWRDYTMNKERAEAIHREDAAAYERLYHPSGEDEADKSSSPEVQPGGDRHIAQGVREDEATSTNDPSPTAAEPSTTATPQESNPSASTSAEQTSKLKDGDTSQNATEEPKPSGAESDTTMTTETTGTVAAGDGDRTHRQDDLCYICMDLLVDCILLECGHMITCTQCGKRLTECPVCRQYIVRVVRVFRS